MNYNEEKVHEILVTIAKMPVEAIGELNDAVANVAKNYPTEDVKTEPFDVTECFTEDYFNKRVSSLVKACALKGKSCLVLVDGCKDAYSSNHAKPIKDLVREAVKVDDLLYRAIKEAIKEA